MEAFDTESSSAVMSRGHRVGIEDMIKMDNLSEEGILKNIKERYLADFIYVRTLLLILIKLSLYLRMLCAQHTTHHMHNNSLTLGSLDEHRFDFSVRESI